jgi:transposase
MNAYSQNLTEKIVLAVFEHRMGKSEAARALGVSLSSVKRYARAASVDKSLTPKKKPGSYPKLDERARRLLAADVEQRRFLTLCERRDLPEGGGGRSLGE